MSPLTMMLGYSAVTLLVGVLIFSLYSRFLSRKWNKGTFPIMHKLVGSKYGVQIQYRVKMLPRFLFFWFRDIKVMETYCTVGGGWGHNVAYGRIEWGKYWLIGRRLSGWLELDYTPSRWPFRLIVDRIVKIGRGRYLGKFYLVLRINGRIVFRVRIFWFLLERIA